jgi:hypothetical protein
MSYHSVLSWVIICRHRDSLTHLYEWKGRQPFSWDLFCPWKVAYSVHTDELSCEKHEKYTCFANSHSGRAGWKGVWTWKIDRSIPSGAQQQLYSKDTQVTFCHTCYSIFPLRFLERNLSRYVLRFSRNLVNHQIRTRSWMQSELVGFGHLISYLGTVILCARESCSKQDLMIHTSLL